jgi:hypothetical protein
MMDNDIKRDINVPPIWVPDSPNKNLMNASNKTLYKTQYPGNMYSYYFRDVTTNSARQGGSNWDFSNESKLFGNASSLASKESADYESNFNQALDVHEHSQPKYVATIVNQDDSVDAESFISKNAYAEPKISARVMRSGRSSGRIRYKNFISNDSAHDDVKA